MKVLEWILLEAARLWTQQARRPGNDAAVLGNAARFFQVSDKEQAAALLKGAQRAAPQDAQWSGRLGYLYAIGILGVDMINQNAPPTSHSPAESKGAFATRAREGLERSTDANVFGAAGSILAQYGLMMGGMFRERFAVDYAPLAEALLLKAQELTPPTHGGRWLWNSSAICDGKLDARNEPSQRDAFPGALPGTPLTPS